MNSHYPTIKQGFGLFGLGIGCHLIAGLASYGISNDWQLFAGQLVANLLVLAVALRLKWGEVDFAFYFSKDKKFSLWVLPVLMVFNIAYIYFMDPILELMPMPEWVEEMFAEMMNKSLGTFLAMAILAPVGEELLFRKTFLPGLVKNYGETTGILWSAFFFAVFHLNPWQGLTAFCIGIFLAWIYLRTQNIWVPIFLHFFNNSLAFAFYYFSEDPYEETPDYLGEYQWLILMVISGVVMYLCVRILQRLFIPLEPCKEDQEETEPQEHLEI